MDTIVGTAVIAMASTSQIAYLRAHARPVDAQRQRAASVRSFRWVYPAVMGLLFVVGLDTLLGNRFGLRTWAVARSAAVAGLVAMALGSALFFWARRSLGQQYSPCFDSRRPTAVVGSGPYRWLQHPLYAGNLVAMAGAVVATGSSVLGIAWLVTAVAYVRAAALENVLLRELRVGCSAGRSLHQDVR